MKYITNPESPKVSVTVYESLILSFTIWHAEKKGVPLQCSVTELPFNLLFKMGTARNRSPMYGFPSDLWLAV
jgi:hypothetical protein